MAYELVEPFGSPAIEQLVGRVIANLLAPHLKEGAQLDADDFVPDRAAGLREYLENKKGS